MAGRHFIHLLAIELFFGFVRLFVVSFFVSFILCFLSSHLRVSYNVITCDVFKKVMYKNKKFPPCKGARDGLQI